MHALISIHLISTDPPCLRSSSQLFAIVVFGCISSQGWYREDGDLKSKCMYNDNSGACNYGTGIAVIAFLACFAFIAGEFFFNRMSSVKTRKHYVLADLGFSGELVLWARSGILLGPKLGILFVCRSSVNSRRHA